MPQLQKFRQYSRPQVVQPTRTKFIIQPFTLSPSTWAGASIILAEYNLGNSDYLLSFKAPVEQFGENFIAAVRWLEENNTVVFRYKFWDDPLAVLFYPIYSGETIGTNGVIEIWSINTTSAPMLSEDEILYSSVLNFPRNFGCNQCCVLPDVSTLLLPTPESQIGPCSYCNPFTLPMNIP